MRELLVILAVTSATLTVFPRYDGVVLELAGESRLTPDVQARGHSLRVEISEGISLVQD